MIKHIQVGHTYYLRVELDLAAVSVASFVYPRKSVLALSRVYTMQVNSRESSLWDVYTMQVSSSESSLWDVCTMQVNSRESSLWNVYTIEVNSR
jgi:hypothetical protein